MTTINTILSNIVTYQDNAYNNNLKEISIGNFIHLIKSEKYKDIIFKLRNLLDNGDERRYKREKIRLPAITFSGLFSEKRTIESLTDYNSICVIDIDNISNQDIQRYLNLLQSDPFIFSFWLSPSGKGIKGLVKFNYATTLSVSTSYEAHKFAFSELNNYFMRKYNIEIDKSGSDVTRLCFVSSDSNLVIKEQADDFSVNNQNITISASINIKHKDKHKSTLFNKKEHLYPVGKNKQINRTKIQKIIKYLKKRNLSITDTYDKWYRVAYAISSTFTYDLGEKYFLQLCRLDGSKHNEEESKAMLQYCYVNNKGVISFGTIQFYFYKFKEVGGSRTEEASSKIDP
jgi:VirE N-terminal domain.